MLQPNNHARLLPSLASIAPAIASRGSISWLRHPILTCWLRIMRELSCNIKIKRCFSVQYHCFPAAAFKSESVISGQRPKLCFKTPFSHYTNKYNMYNLGGPHNSEQQHTITDTLCNCLPVHSFRHFSGQKLWNTQRQLLVCITRRVQVTMSWQWRRVWGLCTGGHLFSMHIVWFVSTVWAHQ